MTGRQLLTNVGFTIDPKQIAEAEKTIVGIKNTAGSAVKAVKGIGEALGISFKLDNMKEIADETITLRARIGLVTKDAQEQDQVLSSIRDISNETRQGYVATGNLYANLAQSSKQFGASQEDVLKATETINKALVVGGASMADAASTSRQLGQGLASGKVDGNVLNSLSKNAPLLMQEIASAYGVTVEQLKQMGAAGELESQGIFQAVVQAKGKMDKEFEKMPVTIGQAMTVAGNSFSAFIGDIERDTGFFKNMATGIVEAVKWIDNEIRYLAASAGGWGNMFKIAEIAVAAFLAALSYIKIMKFISAIKEAGGVISWLGVGNPYILGALAVAAAVALLAAAFQDVYTWINGGNSVIGGWLGSWDEFKAKASTYVTPLIDGFNRLWQGIQANVIPVIMQIWDAGVAAFNGLMAVLGPIVSWIIGQFMEITNNGQLIFDLLLTIWQGVVNGILLSLQFFRQIFEGDFSGAIDTVIAYFQNLLNMAWSIFTQIGAAIQTYVISKLGWIGEKIAELTGIRLGNLVSLQNAAIAGVPSSSSTANQFNFSITTGPGTTAAQNEAILKGAELSYQGVYGVLRYGRQ